MTILQILLRGDSGFAREPLMRWCEDHEGVEYVFGLAKNARLERRLELALERAHELCAETGHPIRLYTTFRYSTLETWSRKRRVVGKAQITPRGENPRFVVTSLPRPQQRARTTNSHQLLTHCRPSLPGGGKPALFHRW